ncbi:hypothetical protein C1E23_16725 [Pseudoalteromonas phenolica]|uniref:Uncharacterized protein n=1 Tax=Pseudoalteromonas phenolica TaxID=161398 RepID=A0A4V2EJD0_9GAMM|nr:hypothetical protein [Pseudoalteromonas phenolica]RZQ51918.1 hypothetical protein C1E23_16725 [Pseudoalteromonas phenolica]
MKDKEIKFESGGWFKTIQQVWLGLIIIVALSLAVSGFMLNQQASHVNILSMCIIAVLLHMGYMSFQCCRYTNINIIIKDDSIIFRDGENDKVYSLTEVNCIEFAIASVYKITNSKGEVICYFNGLLPKAKAVANRLNEASPKEP